MSDYPRDVYVRFERPDGSSVVLSGSVNDGSLSDLVRSIMAEPERTMIFDNTHARPQPKVGDTVRWQQDNGTIDWYRVKAVTFKDDGTPRVELEPLDNE